MTTRKMEGKCEELKYYFNARMSKQEKNLTKVLIIFKWFPKRDHQTNSKWN